MENCKDIVWISTQDWDDVWTRKQRFALYLSEKGYRILYVEAQLHWAGFMLNKELRKFKRIFKFTNSPKEIKKNIFVATPPLVFPGQTMSKIINRINKLFMIYQINKLLKKLNIKNYYLWVYPPDSIDLIDRLKYEKLIFDCVDDWSRFSGLVSKQTMEKYMNDLFRRADLVVVTHEELRRKANMCTDRVALIPNGVEANHFDLSKIEDGDIPEEMKRIIGPKIGFIGSVAKWIDYDLLHYIAVNRPEWSIIMIGPVSNRIKIDKIRQQKNIYLLGRKAYNDLPKYIKAFDVCINPFVVDELSDSVDPLKMYEYLATGKPIVSVKMPAVNRFKGLIDVAKDKKEFVKCIEKKILNSSQENLQAKRIQIANEHSWQKRYEQLYDAIQQL